MAVYKVPQDVEADDKLLGPLSFRQFIYAIVAAVGVFIAYLMAQIFIGLFVIPLPVIILFGVLALPLRKDQPMEMYLIAVIRFFLKPRLRKWEPEGAVKLVEIVAPRNLNEQRTNNLDPNEARSRLGHLAELMDTRGWSAKGVLDPALQTTPNITVSDSDISNDIMDKDANVAQSFENLLAKKDVERHKSTQQKMDSWRQAAEQPQDNTLTASSAASPGLDDIITQQQSIPLANANDAASADSAVHFNPYPSSIHQHVLQPLGDTPTPQPKTQQTTSDKAVTSTVSPDIMRLATESKNLSISTIAHEAHRLENKQDDNNEVVISLR